MSLNFLRYLNKSSIMRSMSHKDGGYRELLDGFSGQELRVLRENPDLVSRVKEIAKMSVTQVLTELREEYSLEVDQYEEGSRWINTEKLDGAIPEWFYSDSWGEHVSAREGEFMGWSRNFLVQDVRINIWVRYLQQEKREKSALPPAGYR